MPSETIERFERSVAAGKRSSVIAQVVNDWLDEQENEALRADIAEECREMGDLYLEIEKEWHPLEEEVDRLHGDE